MKKLLLSVAALGCFVSAQAQWVNNSNVSTTSTTESINRTGNVNVGGFPSNPANAANLYLTAPSATSNALRLENGVFSMSSSSVFRIDAPNAPGWRVTIATNGNVGLGTITPASKLDLGGNFGAPGTTPNKISLYWQASNNYYGFGISEATLGKWSALGQPPTAFPTGGEYFGLFRNWEQQSFITGLLQNADDKKDGVIAWGDATATNSNPSDL